MKLCTIAANDLHLLPIITRDQIECCITVMEIRMGHLAELTKHSAHNCESIFMSAK